MFLTIFKLIDYTQSIHYFFTVRGIDFAIL